jgi:hypothetical protein
VSTLVVSALTESVATAVESVVVAVAVASFLHDTNANVTTKAKAKITFFIVFVFINKYVIFWFYRAHRVLNIL